ncbi:mycofactocin-coupled SDR family oxidoreductase [Subtercola sp. YIM 133946]|uniref:mycofactocin-coupled SDR family oxidoreductase n=1 Tax=Subtercola sp. YIM 133946 TaxID=3118909 RepID=UPI002F91C1B8
MGRLEGKVAFITGAARGQGRSHALRLAEEGADIIAVDIVEQIGSVPYDLATEDDLAETVRQVEALDRRIIASKADVRDFDQVKAAVDAGVAELGRLDIVCANAGILSFGTVTELSEDSWRDMLDVHVTGGWHTAKAAIPHIRAGGRGGSIVLTSSTAAIRPYENMAHYVTAKHGVVGLMKALAIELAKDNIRVNAVHPTNVDTPMIQNQATYGLFSPDMKPEDRTREVMEPSFATINALPIGWVDPVDISNAIMYLVSDDGRYVTGISLPVDAGFGIH